MSRPLLNLSIVELTQLFEDSVGKLNVIMDLLKELRHRSTPKANALNKRVMEVIAQNSSYAVLQSLHVPELEALAIDCSNKPHLRENLIEVLQTRGSAKGQQLLGKLTNVGANAGAGKFTEDATRFDKSESHALKSTAPTQSATLSMQKPTLITKPLQATMISDQFVTSNSSLPKNVEQAFSLFELSTTASWNAIEEARQRLVTKYRPGAVVDKASASTALKLIADAHTVLADYMKNKN